MQRMNIQITANEKNPINTLSLVFETGGRLAYGILLLLLLKSPRPDSPRIFQSKKNEERHTRDLKTQTGNHDIRPCRWILVVLAADASETAPRALQDQANDIIGDENLSVAGGFDPAGSRRDSRHDVAKGEVDCCSEKSGLKGQRADLD